MFYYADIIIQGASFFPGLNLPEDYDYIALKDSRILSMGKGQCWKQYCGPETQVLEFTKEQLVVPGFHDSHLHLLMSALNYHYVDLFDVRSEKEAAELVAEFAKSHPDDEWIIGLNWYHMDWDRKELPTKKSLDRHLPDRPVFLINTEVHGAWVNSKALEVCGIDDSTPDPESGEIVRDEKGEATGYLNETAMSLCAVVALTFDIPKEKELIGLALEQYASFGVTSVQDLRPELGYDLGQYETYYQMAREGKLKARVHSAANLMDPIDEVIAQRERYNGDLFQIALLKQYMDGVPTTHTAMNLEPYVDAPDLQVKPLGDIRKMKEQIEKAHRNGLSVKVHCCGDGAVRQTLDLYENAIEKYGETASRHAVEHLEIIHADDIERMAKYHIIASMQPEHMVIQVDRWVDNPYLDKYSPAQLETTWCFRTLLDKGITLAFGSDCPVVSVNPLMGIYRAVTRLFNDGNPKGGMNPEQKISVREALHCYTYHSAYGIHREHELGTLEPGKLADLAVLDHNILETDPSAIPKTQVLMTVMNGKITYQK